VLIVGGGTIAVATGVRKRTSAVTAATLTAAMYILFLKRIRRAHFSWDGNVFSLVGLPLFSYLLLRSKMAHMNGTVSWKGRRYAENRSSAISYEVRAGRPHDSRRDAGASATPN